jgi:hypothetical protein
MIDLSAAQILFAHTFSIVKGAQLSDPPSRGGMPWRTDISRPFPVGGGIDRNGADRPPLCHSKFGAARNSDMCYLPVVDFIALGKRAPEL